MANFVNSGHQAIPYLRRELEDLFDDMELPRRMRREMDRLFAEATSPMWLWRDMDQLLEEFVCPLPLRNRIQHVFSRYLPVNAGSYFTRGLENFTGRGGEFFTPWRNIDSFTSGRGEYFTPWRSLDSFTGRGEYFTPWRSIDSFTSGRGGEYFTPWRSLDAFGSGRGGEYFTPWRGVDSFSPVRNDYFSPVRGGGEWFSPVRNDYFSPVRGGGEWFSPMRSSFGRGIGFRTNEDFVPPVELIERDGEYLVRVELAGVREQDVEIRTNDHVLTIRGERRERFDNEARHMGNYEYSERRYGTFSRTVTLPHGIDTAHIHAVFRDGVLELRIPQTETFRQRRIPIGREERVINEGNAQRPHVS